MKKYCYISLSLVFSCISQITLGQQTQSKISKPNIIFILADDNIGYETINCNGGTSYQTPNINQLAAKGIRFTNAYLQIILLISSIELIVTETFTLLGSTCDRAELKFNKEDISK